MKILLTGATGYIGKRLMPLLVEKGYTVVCAVRDVDRFKPPSSVKNKIEVIEIDLLNAASLKNIPTDIDGAYYLVHSMSAAKNYKILEKQSAINFRKALNETAVKHVIYLSGIVNDKELSEHLASRKQVEEELDKGNYNFTTLRAGIIIGSGSASFEIIRDLVEKLPVMVAPKWLNTRCQPVGISDVMSYLKETLFNSATYNKHFDIGGKDVLTYKQMLLGFAKVRQLNRLIFTVPVMTPRLSSYWLYFVTSTSYKLAKSLVDSMKVEVVCQPNNLNTILDIEPISYQAALLKAFKKIQSNAIVSSWKDAYSSSGFTVDLTDFIKAPLYGCFKDARKSDFDNQHNCIERIWKIGGETGWYCGNKLWQLRGFLDKLVGGVGLRRGRTNINTINPGDALDFWRVLYPFHEFIFNGMLKKLCGYS